MTLFLIFLALILVSAVVWTLTEVARDGYRPVPSCCPTRTPSAPAQ
jgi:hypothetical protein